MKKLINLPEAIVDDAIAGMLAAHPHALRLLAPGVIVREPPARPGKVGIISGGGSGHEPMHVGLVGTGMLDAACHGGIFTSPAADQVLAATRAVDTGAGVLYVVGDYVGDVMSFGRAAELARAEGHSVSTVVIADDVAVEDSLYSAGRRGVAGTLPAEKIAGAAAEAGADLATVAAVCQKVQDNVRSMGVALASGTVPSVGVPTFDLGDDEMEIGIGIHGEPGRSRHRLAPAMVIAEMLANPILDDLPFSSGDRVLAFVNGLGATPLHELYIVFGALARILAERGITIERSLVGSYVTSLDMAGCSISLLRLDDELTGLWDAPVSTPALRWSPADGAPGDPSPPRPQGGGR